eukprot:6983602-Prymnesium_polylepis.1
MHGYMYLDLSPAYAHCQCPWSHGRGFGLGDGDLGFDSRRGFPSPCLELGPLAALIYGRLATWSGKSVPSRARRCR